MAEVREIKASARPRSGKGGARAARREALVPGVIYGDGRPPENIALGHSPRGHPEGLCEAFGNIYAEVAQERMARSLGEPVPDLPYPRIEEGAHTMAFIEACVASQANGTWVDVRSKPAG